MTPQYIGRSDVTQSMVTIRSPCCGYNLALCVELKGEDIWSYSTKLNQLVYENAHTTTNLPTKRI